MTDKNRWLRDRDKSRSLVRSRPDTPRAMTVDGQDLLDAQRRPSRSVRNVLSNWRQQGEMDARISSLVHDVNLRRAEEAASILELEVDELAQAKRAEIVAESGRRNAEALQELENEQAESERRSTLAAARNLAASTVQERALNTELAQIGFAPGDPDFDRISEFVRSETEEDQINVADRMRRTKEARQEVFLEVAVSRRRRRRND